MADQTPTDDPSDFADVKAPPGLSPEQMAEDAMSGVAKAAQSIAAEAAPGDPQRLDLVDFAGASGEGASALGLGLLDDVTLKVKVELGRTQMYVEDVLRLTANSIVELDKAAGDPVDIFVNERHVARGEVLVLNENFCVRVSEIIQQSGEEE